LVAATVHEGWNKRWFFNGSGGRWGRQWRLRLMDICLQKEIEKHLKPIPGALEFVDAYGTLVHAVDDLIDRDNPEIKDYKLHVLDCFGLAADVYSNPFYHSNLWLYPIVKNIHRVYSDSIVWETAAAWKGQVADTLRSSGHEIIMAILEHLCRLPFPDLRRISLGLRENSWHEHHDAEGRPI
jgi:hypothetical protein